MTITDRMRQVLQGIADGLTNKEIAVVLKVSPKTIDKHRRKLYERFQVDNAVALVVAALRAKTITL